jgi:hypothetical protein
LIVTLNRFAITCSFITLHTLESYEIALRILLFCVCRRLCCQGGLTMPHTKRGHRKQRGISGKLLAILQRIAWRWRVHSTASRVARAEKNAQDAQRIAQSAARRSLSNGKDAANPPE